jgi:hypothetical protein
MNSGEGFLHSHILKINYELIISSSSHILNLDDYFRTRMFFNRKIERRRNNIRIWVPRVCGFVFYLLDTVLLFHTLNWPQKTLVYEKSTLRWMYLQHNKNYIQAWMYFLCE